MRSSEGSRAARRPAIRRTPSRCRPARRRRTSRRARAGLAPRAAAGSPERLPRAHLLDDPALLEHLLRLSEVVANVANRPYPGQVAFDAGRDVRAGPIAHCRGALDVGGQVADLARTELAARDRRDG